MTVFLSRAFPPWKRGLRLFLRLAERMGPQRVVWHYEPVILTSATPLSWHLEQCERLASRLAGATRRLVFSFCDYYGKGPGRLHAALQESGITLADLTSVEHSGRLRLKKNKVQRALF